MGIWFQVPQIHFRQYVLPDCNFGRGTWFPKR
jgi:hypothetical protein